MDAGPSYLLGYGQLGAYAIRSNTFASKLVHHVLGDKQGATPPEGATGTVLEQLRYNAVVAQLLALGPAPAPLALIAKFMGQVAQIFVHLLRRSAVSKCHCEARVVMLQRQDHIWRIELESSANGERRFIHAEHVVLALGAFQESPQLDQRQHQAKVICSNETLSANGLQKLRAKLGPKQGKICIVGGAHSAFSAAWLCLHGENGQYYPNVNLPSSVLALPPPVKRAATARTAPTSPCRSLISGGGSVPNKFGGFDVHPACAPNNAIPGPPLSQALPSIDTQERTLTTSRAVDAASISTTPFQASETAMSRTVLPAARVLNVDTSTLPVMPRASLPPLETTTTTRKAVHAAPGPVLNETSPAKFSGLPTSSPQLSITILHRSPVRVFYTSKREAESNGYRDYKQTNRHGQVHAFAGLRGDAKSFYNDVSRGREPRVRLCQVKPGGSKSLIARCFDEAHVIIWATGYKSHIVPVTDERKTSIRLRISQGQIQVDRQGRILRGGSCPQDQPSVVPNIYGNGHGYGLPAVYDNGELDGSKGRADGIAVYMKQAAAVILYAILGSDYPGLPPHIPPIPDKPPVSKTGGSPEKQLAHIDRLCQPRPPAPNLPLPSTTISLHINKANRGSKRQKHNKKSVSPLQPTSRSVISPTHTTR